MSWLAAVIVLVALLAIARIIRQWTSKPKVNPRVLKRIPTIFVMGSGGHTAEMLSLIASLLKPDQIEYSPRAYVVADTDTSSVDKVKSVDSEMNDANTFYIPRTREVGQSWTSVLSKSIWLSLYAAWSIVSSVKPALIVCNGPGTCVPICLAALIRRVCYYSVDEI